MARLSDQNLILEDGDILEFPAPADSPFIECQTMRAISTLADVRNFGFIQEWMRGFSSPDDRSLPGSGRLVAGGPAERIISAGQRFTSREMLRFVREISGGVVMNLQLADFVVPVGATVILSSPLAEIKANTVVIAGQLKFTDDLAIQCNEIRGA
ncbi:hypothetical protein QFZ65_002471 [Arthrobacter sp. B3I9]|uniref:hypothetical protein n=1 Tax=Arthrobacter sp. B3I9 TaxID=3042270 RepID=UPI00278DE500|nr:hypothetical protein [Arthrobacter sp. B3I9]MDQ0850533.1 hypothetical protein [Arthrobacter sp. B3I9]